MTNFEKIFGKSRDELTIDDIRDFFSTPQEETSILEFKDGRTDLEKVCPEITAFANTQGGLLFIGAPTERKEKRKSYCQGEITFSKIAKNKTALLQKISSRIVPSPMGLEVFEFLTSEGNFFIIDVPQSTIPPHQNSNDGKYYIRLEEESKFAPHGLIQAMFMKRRLPELQSDISITEFNEEIDIINITIYNKSSVPAEKVHYGFDTVNLRYIETTEISFKVDWIEGKKHHYCTDQLDGILPSEISFDLTFRASHKQDIYVIRTGLWCRSTDYKQSIYIYNPLEKTLTPSSDMVSGLDELNKAEDSQEQQGRP